MAATMENMAQLGAQTLEALQQSAAHTMVNKSDEE